MTLKAVIFDKDGVLADSEKLKAEAWARTLADLGVSDGNKWYLRNLGPTTAALAKKAVDEFRVHAVIFDVVSAWNDCYKLLKHEVEPILDNLQVLSMLSRQYRIAIASSMDKSSIEHEIRRFGYWDYIDACVSGEDVPNNKPAPDVYLAAASALNVEPSECVAVEDTPAGVHAAKAAGMFCVGYKNPLYDLDLSAADIAVSNLACVSFSALLRS